MTIPLQRDLERFRSVPRLEALEALRPQAPVARLLAGWTAGRVAFALVAAVVLHSWYSSLAVGVNPLLLGTVALVAGVVAAGYLPRAGVLPSRCGACTGLLSLVGAAWALQATPGVTGGVLALGLLGAALVQRLVGPSSC